MRKKTFALKWVPVCFVVVFVWCAGVGALGSAKIGWSLTNSQDVNSVLVLLAERPALESADLLRDSRQRRSFVVNELRRTAERSQSSLSDFLATRGVAFRSFAILNAVAIPKADRHLLKELADRKDVRKIIADSAMRLPALVKTAAIRGLTTGSNIAATGAPAVWAEGFRGQGIVVAGQDTGVDWTHPALKPSYRGGLKGAHDFNWHDAIHANDPGGPNACGFDSPVPCDDDRHGTHTLGTIVGDDGVGHQIGMAPAAQWMACRNMNKGYGHLSSYLECYEWMLAPYAIGADPKTGDPARAPNIINNSWGCDVYQGCQGEELIPVLKALYTAGVLNVASAGNSGPNCETIRAEPATISAYAITVGAYDESSGEIARFSSRGPSVLTGAIGPDITAPGVTILSSVPGGGYESAGFSGTSMAGPHVAGAVALLWSAQPKLIGKIDATIALLKATAKPMKDPGHNCGTARGFEVPNNTYGFGLLDVHAAVKKARTSFVNTFD